MSDLEQIERQAAKVLVAIGIVFLVGIFTMPFIYPVQRDRTAITLTKDWRENNDSLSTVPPASQERFLR